MDNRSYVLVTPVKNEAATIGQTIRSVVRQTLPPREWLIVSDGSTDDTDRIIGDAAVRHPWIRLLRLPARSGRCFSAVVRNTETGIGQLACGDYRYLGLLDGDVMFQEDYYNRLIDRFEIEPRLGIAGGAVIDPGHSRNRFPRNLMDVPGAVQFFRRECFESLGGLIALPEGGWDGLTCAIARMNGYQTRLFTDLVVDHLKPRNISQGGALQRKWQMGVRDHALGYHPLFEAIKCLGRTGERPLLLGALAWWLGYASSTIRQRPRRIGTQLVNHVRAEQIQRLKNILDAGITTMPAIQDQSDHQT
jgi:biofilm PGA synthesis N-glycosyltransferase PgaC